MTVISLATMASIKLYKKQPDLKVISRCRLCNCVANPQYSKNLFRDSNRALLRSTEDILGGELTRDSSLPYLVCRPCERRVMNFCQFRGVIIETQRLLQQGVHTKRCIELSPSVAKPSPKVRAACSSHRRSIDFSDVVDESQNSQVSILSLL